MSEGSRLKRMEDRKKRRLGSLIVCRGDGSGIKTILW